MCTTIAFNSGKLCFGRNMDLPQGFGERVVILQRNFALPLSGGGSVKARYSAIGMAAVADGYPLFADGMNEHGLCAAALNFPQYAAYPDSSGGISPYELIGLVLTQCADVSEARSFIGSRGISAVPFSRKISLTPLHWHIADSSGSIVVESTARGLEIHDNKVGVLTNSPPFEYHLNNLRRCLNITSGFVQSRFSDSLRLTASGGGFGGIGLWGDFSSESRFVRAAFMLHNSDSSGVDCVAQCFHLLEGAAVPQGSVVNEDGRLQRTLYSCCMDTAEKVYYYRTYGGSALCAVSLIGQESSAQLIEYTLETAMHVNRINY